MPALPDQALLGPCTGEIALDGRYGELVDEADASCAASQRCSEMLAARWRRRRKARVRARRHLPRPLGRCWRQSPTRASTPRASRRPTSSPRTRRAGQTCVQVFFFRTGQNWGNRAYFPRADRSIEPRRCWTAFSPSSTTTSRRPTDPAVARDRRPRAARRGAVAQGRPQGRDPRAAARREAPAGRACAGNAREALAGAGARPPRSAACSRAGASASGSTARRAASRSTTTATSRAPTRSAP